jgi:hypothetical protein
MVHFTYLRNAFVLALLALLSVPAVAQQAPAPSAQKTLTSERRIQFGFDQRVRNEDWNNLFDFSDKINDKRVQMRYRSMFWATVPFSSNVDLVAGLNSESTVKRCPGALPAACVNHFDEIVFDRLYFDVRKVFIKGLALRLGRQNIQEGEGFLILEGTPGDGSKDIYLNAVNLNYSWKKSKLELIGIFDPKTDRFLPQIHSRHKPLNDWDDEAVGLYYTNKNHARTNYEAYYFYKKEVHDHKANLAAVIQPDRDIHTVGGRVVQLLTPTVSLTGEWAQQSGSQQDNKSIAAWGGYGYAKKTFGRKWKPYILGGYWAMSGADPRSTTVNGNFDPIFARWPKFSELYLYSQLKEYGIGMNTNLNQVQGEAGFSPWKPITCRVTYYHMGAYHPFPGNPAIFGSGLSRGDLLETRIDYVINKNWSGHSTIEHVTPGDFYKDRNAAYFLQFEISYRFLFSTPMPKR